MISVDTMEVLLRTLPMYFLFAALSFLIFSWINKKPLYSMIAELILIVTGILALIVLLSGYIPSPNTNGEKADDLKSIINMLVLFSTIGFLSAISILIRFIKKKQFAALLVVIFILTLILFFQATRLSRVKFELNKTTSEVVRDSIKK